MRNLDLGHFQMILLSIVQHPDLVEVRLVPYKCEDMLPGTQLVMLILLFYSRTHG